MDPLRENTVMSLKHDYFLLSHSSLSHCFRDDAFLMATYLINRLPTTPLGISPFENLFNKSPDFSVMKVFGCACYPYLSFF